MLLITIAVMAFLMLAAVLYFSGTPIGTTVVVLGLTAFCIGTAGYVFLGLDDEQRAELLYRLNLADIPLDIVALTNRCQRIVEDQAKLPSGAILDLGAPRRNVTGANWTVTWTAGDRATVPAGTYGCSGEALSIRSVEIAGRTTSLDR